MKYVLFIIFLIALFITSETIYITKNEPQDFALIPLAMSKIFLNNNNLDGAVNQINSSTSMYFPIVKKYYSLNEDFPKPVSDLHGIKDDTRSEILRYLKGNIYLSRKFNNKNLSNIYYKIALILLNKGETEKSLSFMDTAIKLHPSLSHLYIEYANIYFKNNKYPGGINKLAECANFESAKQHCKNYYLNNVKSNKILDVGNYRTEIDHYQLGSD